VAKDKEEKPKSEKPKPDSVNEYVQKRMDAANKK